jgi:MFS family permease
MTRRELIPLLVLFGSLYFIQGIVEPTAGLLTQPVQSQLSHWSLSAAQIGQFMAFIAIPWSLKPVFGLLSDFVPLGGRRRRPYLLLTAVIAAAAFGWLGLTWGSPAGLDTARWLLLVATAAVAFTDVVIDASAVEAGQPRGITGQLQSVQWGAMSAATILAGTAAGYVAEHKLLRPAFHGCALLCLAGLVVVLLALREPRRSSLPQDTLATAWTQLRSGRRLVILLSVSAFLFLWSFNPFSSTVQQLYMTKELGLSEQFYGNMYSLQSAAQVVACIGYGWFCRRVPLGWLVHLSIAAGVIGTLCYAPMQNAATAVIASIVFGLAYQTALLIQLDLAARVCPTESAGTIFSLLMAISNTGMSLGIYAGGMSYDGLFAWLGSRHLAFDLLVLIGAAFTAGCWLLVPVMKWAGVEWK